ncbi:MAG: class II D-tagatose-bisphosphate aldolase, non-catalytic subunit [[Lactobacillus] timonensis]|jgi:tagatose-1,6-bisphosphate aldolase non-catalytic subunit AgaZ/GatZ|uniref:class II D-tagatose-bisphosphate aldolase non-catalytic subunit n=1 Tax=[Lactobacillus] timonensis TaxID=1970790 RepID=UPI00235269DF|nr:class II D-tagatose-bisphosphate aldolase, non-catalytic subunit [[Lactobacillus] timonensis]MCI1925406.1 class II D-tagatose-bisphosphate aldolase, non-catalytic subunit [[Lactobacillus] timonensis]MCI1956842.1 class II D-tagatose-bisphosphate aldolase, non-catalytic subunit [[Lactobacillus] timonensis]MCI1969832.1 class II D-tagatose-bisphosphate aldolase, non-catalytic subunit [[Lactobacillus] timonensis]MCI2005955.1 class II D-tagatose-bisphosphate aldolase, non-catalytic subunit [[Lacto
MTETNDLSIKQTVTNMLKLQDEGRRSTLIGIGPMSPNLLEATFELGRDYDFPLMFIASRNQVDKDDLGGGYVNGWNQETFTRDIKAVADKTGFKGLYYVCRDHGGPWQRDEERNAHLPVDEAMVKAKESYLSDIENGFDLLMIDPTKNPYEMGKVIDMDKNLKWTFELIQYCENERKKRGLPEIGYEVGTEETNGGLTTTDRYETFVQKLKAKLDENGLPMPTFIVGQTGTLTRLGEQVGHWNLKNTLELTAMAKKYGVGLKEHNADYLSDYQLLLHNPANITASNVAPQYGTAETEAYVTLYNVEQRLHKDGLVDDPSNLKPVLIDRAVRTERWRKWMEGDDVNLKVEDVLANDKLKEEILHLGGHYAFNNPDVKKEIAKMTKNLEANYIDVHGFVIESIKRPIRQYIQALNLTGLTTAVRKMGK